MNKRTFPTLHVASAMTGVSLTSGFQFSAFHEIIEFFAGHPVWMHELGSKTFLEPIQAAAYAQFPKMPTKDDALAVYEEAGSMALLAYGEEVEVMEGALTRPADPVSTVRHMMEAIGRPQAAGRRGK